MPDTKRNSTHHTQARVVHNYVDRSQDPSPSAGAGFGNGLTCNVNTEHNFPMKLHYMLTSIAADGESDIVSWMPHGRCFMVHDLKEFVANMLPLWFRQSKFASFQRQLNLYGFQRITSGPDKGGYYHELFLRSRPDLAQNIPRQKVKGRGARKASSPETEPRFYEMKPMPPDNMASSQQSTMDDNDISTLPSSTSVLSGMSPNISLNFTPGEVGTSAMVTANPPVSLGEALGFFSFVEQQDQHVQPIAPAPTANTFNLCPKILENNPGATNVLMNFTEDDYNSIVAALRANAQQQMQSLDSGAFTQPGPSFF